LLTPLLNKGKAKRRMKMSPVERSLLKWIEIGLIMGAFSGFILSMKVSYPKGICLILFC